MSLQQVTSMLSSTLYTLLLFIWSDIKTILIPITVFGTIAAPSTSLSRLPHTLSWVALHLLQCCMSNQSLPTAPDEDAENKPWRPIPANRISQSAVRKLRWALLPLCLAQSLYYGIPLSGCLLATGFWAYHEGGMDSHWLTRNLCVALGYVSFNWGATYVACDNAICELNPTTPYAHLGAMMIVFTTIHASDFADTSGDRVRGRMTFPLVFPEASRLSMILMLPLWSILLSLVWKVNIVGSISVTLFALYTGYRFLLLSSPEAHKLSYVLYNVWLCTAQVIPFVGHARLT